MFKKEVRGAIVALFCLSFGGLLLHLRIHPPMREAENWLAAGFGILTSFAVPFMFNHRKTATWAYLINLSSVIIGTVAMAYYSVTHWTGPVTPVAVVLNSTLADIIILMAKLPMAQLIMSYWRQQGAGES